MNRKVNTVKLREELNIIDNYIYLQKIRFDQLFIIENLITEDVMECEIIKMIIQPLIENAIYHGLSECSSNGKIIIQGQKVCNQLLLTISDNGICLLYTSKVTSPFPSPPSEAVDEQPAKSDVATTLAQITLNNLFFIVILPLENLSFSYHLANVFLFTFFILQTFNSLFYFFAITS